MPSPKKAQTLPVKYPSFWLYPTLLLGLVMRFYNATAVALWHNEALSALYLKYHWREMLHLITLDGHPPLYYILLRFWYDIFGWGLLSLRGFSIFFGVLAIYMGYLFVKQAFENEGLAILAALLLAVNPFQIEYSIQVSPYALGVFFVLLSSYLLLRALESNKTSVWVCYGLSVMAAFYTHYYLFFSIAAQGLYLLYYLWKHKQWVWQGWCAYLLSVILCIPWLPIWLIQIKRVEVNFWLPSPTAWSVPGTVWTMVFGGNSVGHLTAIIAALVGLVILYFFLKKTKAEASWLIGLSFVLPLLGGLILSFRQAAYTEEYFVVASAFFSMVIAGTIYLVPKYTTKKYLAGAFALLSLFVFFQNWHDLGLPKPGMAGAAGFINTNAQSSDRVYIGSNYVFLNFKYYNKTSIHPELIAAWPLASIPKFSGATLLSQADLVSTDTIFNHPEVKKNDTVWLLWTTGFGSSKPNVPGNWSMVTEKIFGDTPSYKGDIYVTEYHVN